MAECLRPRALTPGGPKFACRQCTPCMIADSSEWDTRAHHEAAVHPHRAS